MAINFIRGNILADNLVRGANLSFQTSGLADVLFIDVINGNVGINTQVTTHTLTVNGNCNISDTVVGGNIETPGTVSALGNITGPVGDFADIIAGNIDVGNIDAGNLEVTGNLSSQEIWSNSFISATGNITGSVISAQGNVVGNNIVAIESSYANIFVGNSASITGTITATDASLTGNVISGNVSSLGLISATGNVVGGNLTTVGDISAVGDVYANNFFSTGNALLGNLTVANTTISTALATGNITLQPTGNALVAIDTTTGLVLPVGNTTQRPSPATAGTLRFNTDSDVVEVYSSTGWQAVDEEITNQILYGDNSTAVFTLDRSTTAAAVLIMFNGVVQLPNVAYTVAGNVVTFAQAPAFSDIIDVRFL